MPQPPCARIERDASLRRMKRSRLYAPPRPSIDEGGEAKTAAIFAAHHEFVRDDARDGASKRWETRMARRYYDELHKEYAICDLSRWRDGAVGLRWRTEAEVLRGEGERTCAARGCDAADGLRSYELPFDYEERGEAKRALVKVRVCRACAKKLRPRAGGGSDDGSDEDRKKRKKTKRTKKKRRRDASP